MFQVTEQCCDKYALKKLTTLYRCLHSDTIAAVDRQQRFRRHKRNYVVSWACILYNQRSSTHAGITAARNRHHTSIDAGRISIYAGHVIFFYHAAYRSWRIAVLSV